MKTETINVTKYYAREPFFGEVEIIDMGDWKVKNFWLAHEDYGVKILMFEIPIEDDATIEEDDVPDEMLVENNIDSYIEMHQNVFRPCEEDEQKEDDVNDYLRFLAKLDNQG